MHYRGLLYRALNPIWAHNPLSGEGARRFGGRFNPKGTPALYTALSIMTAIREANQVGTLQPTTLVAYQADLEAIFDATDANALAHYSLSPADLAAADWRIRMREDGKAPTQLLAERLIRDGYTGILARSFAKGATDADLNIVLWMWGNTQPACVTLVDDEGRLQ
ncbi:RES domain-containing protein [Paracoccus alcaliphilus]|uniref:RES domain-containing protein n=1 Tax=Paracoccus alcaliphilus TaxID=34002 RepID=A0A1H8P6E2_9RHOB|nr:RES domain-containing protein [Paracoccus alcaliphilus]WCR16733.1 RES domain-containing protein [Paracoccus alcaliphilus]SEO37485.1 RES domain-containing protein [Paracoccus alcaliphilus]